MSGTMLRNATFLRRSTAGRLVNGFGTLLSFANPSRTYRAAEAAEITRNAWNTAGRAIRGATGLMDAKLGRRR